MLVRLVATRHETVGTYNRITMLLHHHYTHRDNIDQIKIPFSNFQLQSILNSFLFLLFGIQLTTRLFRGPHMLPLTLYSLAYKNAHHAFQYKLENLRNRCFRESELHENIFFFAHDLEA